MAIPLIPFIAGAVIGSLGTYFFKDKQVRDSVKKGADTVTAKVSQGLESVKKKLSTQAEIEEVEEVETVPEIETEKPSPR